MPQIEWYLKPWGHTGFNDPTYVRVLIDPALISGSWSNLGASLILPYTLVIPEKSELVSLLSLEGGLSWGFSNADNETKLPIPSQIVWPSPQYKLQVPINDRQIEAIEHARNGSLVNFSVQLAGLAAGSASLGSVVPVQCSIVQSLVIERERWLTVLQQLKAGSRRLVELPEPRLPRESPEWAECIRLLDGAILFYQRGEYEQALGSCRSIAEGLPQVLCDVWGLPQKARNQSVAQWITSVEGRLTAAWPDDRLTPGMLRTLFTGAWQWLAPAPHYGTGIPLREDVTFALGLCTNLLHFAGQVLQAHPDPL